MSLIEVYSSGWTSLIYAEGVRPRLLRQGIESAGGRVIGYMETYAGTGCVVRVEFQDGASDNQDDFDRAALAGRLTAPVTDPPEINFIPVELGGIDNEVEVFTHSVKGYRV